MTQAPHLADRALTPAPARPARPGAALRAVDDGLGHLLVIPALPAPLNAEGLPIVTHKLIEGAEAYARAWPGRVVVLLELGQEVSNNLDNRVVRPEDIGFELQVLPLRDERVRQLVQGAAVVLSMAHVRQHHLIGWCRDAGVPIVLNSELSLRTRWQIVRNDRLPLLRRLRRLQWESFEELRLRRAMRRVDGVQCAGTPTFEAYRALNRDALLYFDSRTGESMVVAEATLESRLSHLLGPQRPPLRLAFSGRLVSIKGVQHLPELARQLRERGVAVEFRIFGDGPLRTALQADIDRLGLGATLRLAGVLDYATELVPTVSSEVDLFVCPHVQGDPSCTYIETLACGVPIVGFANEAWSGMLRSGVQGWSVPVGDVAALAHRIAALDRDRPALAVAARAARTFGLAHSFERTFQLRVDHLLRHARRGSGAASPTAQATAGEPARAQASGSQ